MQIPRGSTSVILPIKVLDTALANGSGKVDLTYLTAGLSIAVRAENQAAPTVYATSASNVQDVTTLGTYQAPSTGKARIKEISAGFQAGDYEIHLADSWYALASVRWLLLTLNGGSGAAQTDLLIELTDTVTAVIAGLGSTANVTVIGPVISSSLLSLVRGDDYYQNDGRALSFSASNWPSLTGASVAMSFRNLGTGVNDLANKAGTIPVAGSGSQTVRFELATAETAILTPGARYEFDVQATLATSSHKTTLLRGRVTVGADYSS